MGLNDKSMRVRGLRDRLHLKGVHAPSFKQSVNIIVELLGLLHSPRNLSWCRRETAKLRERFPEMTPEQLQRMGILDDRLLKKATLIKARQERKFGQGFGRGPRKKKEVPAPVSTPAPEAGEINIFEV